MRETRVTVSEVAQFLGGELIGEGDRPITGFAPLNEAQPDQLSFYDNPAYYNDFLSTRAAVVLVGPSEDPRGKTVIRVNSPYLAFARVLQRYAEPPSCPFKGISPAAFVDPTAQVAQSVHVGPGVYIGPHAEVGEETILWPGVSIGPEARVGSHCCLYPHVVVYHGCVIGDRVILHAGCVIGADGFGFAPDGERYEKIPQIGNVVIEDDVEIGANTTVDRAAMGSTRIGRGTKIDNLVMIAHNCRIGENSILVGQVGISGSTFLGRHVMIGGQVGISGHLKIGDFVQIGARSGVTKSVPDGGKILGEPAMPAAEFKRLLAHVRLLPHFRTQLKELKEKVTQLEAELTQGNEEQ